MSEIKLSDRETYLYQNFLYITALFSGLVCTLIGAFGSIVGFAFNSGFSAVAGVSFLLGAMAFFWYAFAITSEGYSRRFFVSVLGAELPDKVNVSMEGDE